MVKLIKKSSNHNAFPVWWMVVLGVVATVILAGGYWFYTIQAQQLEQKAKAELEAIARLKTDQIIQWRKQRLADMNEIIGSPFFNQGITDWLAGKNPDAARKLLSRFEGICKHHHYSNVLLTDLNGEAILALRENRDRITIDDLAQLKTAIGDGKPFLTDLHFHENTTTPIMDVIAPLYDLQTDSPQPLGGLVLQIDPEQFLYPMIESWPVPSRTAETLLVRREGEFVVFLNNLRHIENAALRLKSSLNRQDVPAVRAVLGTTGLFSGIDYRGEQVLSVLLPIADSPWFMVTKMDSSEAFAEIRFNQWMILLLTFGLLAITFSGAGLLWQYMRKLHYKTVYQAELERQALLSHFEYLVKYANDGIVLADENLSIIEANEKAVEIYGYPKEELLSLTMTKLIATEDMENFWQRIRCIKENGSVLAEALHIRKDGVKLPVELSARAIEVRGKKFIQSIVRDIRERKRAEEALRSEQEKFKYLTEKAPFGMVVIGKDGSFKYINPRFTEIFGFDLTDVSDGKTWFKKAYPDPEYRKHVIASWKEDLEKAKPGEQRPKIYMVNCKDGMEKFIHFVPIQLETGDNLMFCDDISEQIEAEKKLKESEERYRALFDRSLDCVYIHDFEGRFIDANDTALQLLGYERNEIQSLNFSSLLNEDQLQMANNLFSEFMETGYQKDIAEFRLKHKDGHPVYVEAKASLVYHDGQPYAVQGIARDISSRKQAEAALRESEERYRVAAQSTGQLIYDYDLISGKIFWAGAIDVITGFSEEEFAGVDIAGWEEKIHPEDRKKALDLLEESINSAAEYNIVYRFQRKDGEYIYVEDIGGFLCNQEGKAMRMFGAMKDISVRRKAEEELQKLAMLIQYSSELVNLANLQGKMIFLNEAGARMLGIKPDEAEKHHILEVVPETHHDMVRNEILPKLLAGGTWEGELQYLNIKTGELIETHAMTFPIKNPATGDLVCLANVSFDITERKRAERERARLEEQLMQSQKLESIGRLAGGVAHDFNNMLAIIIGYADIVLKDLHETNPAREKTKEILKAAERARDLTRQLLAFARKQTLDMTHLELNHVVGGFEKMLLRALRENISIKLHLSPVQCVFQGDVGQIEQIILNIALNSQDAMPNGGTLVVETAPVYLDESYVKIQNGIAPGNYVMLAMSDTGQGMSKVTLEKIFEPFYTTKEVGKGTGLGLSTVYGIVKQHGGHIHVYSEPGKGTSFKIYFPQIQKVVDTAIDADVDIIPDMGKETVLVVEDNEQVRNLSCEILKLHGYKVFDTPDGKTAMEVATSYSGRIHLLITDVIMPDMNGKELHEQMSQIHSSIKTLFMSGYPEDVISHHGVLDAEVNFIQKPFSLHDFVAKVRQVLDAKKF